ncbi:MAG: hypothetical protein U0745_09935 [Polyangia bacterium]
MVAARAVVVQVVAAQVAHAIQTRAVVVVAQAALTQRLPTPSGGGGGGSFGVYIFKSTVTINTATVASGQAGNGGNGANGAVGGSAGTGSAGGAGSENSAGGGRGANGGKGSNSGAGAGGSGGRATVCARRCRRWSPAAFRPAAARLARLATAAKPPSRAHCPKHRLASSDAAPLKFE